MNSAKVQFVANCPSTPNHVIWSLQLVKDNGSTEFSVPQNTIQAELSPRAGSLVSTPAGLKLWNFG